MPQLDVCHDQVVHALEKDGWVVSPVPHAIRAPGRRYPLLADFRARRGQDEIIIVEIKCFVDEALEDLYSAIGQYLVYRYLLRQSVANPRLYLAVPTHAYYGIFRDIGVGIINEAQIRLIVVNMVDEVIEQWIEQ
jgi:hypothetical protein